MICSDTLKDLLVNGTMAPIARNRLDVADGSIVHYGLMKMYCMKLGSFKGKKCWVMVWGENFI